MSKHITQGLTALFYGITSILMTFANKQVVTHHGFEFPATLLSLQFIFTLMCLYSSRAMGWVSFQDLTVSRAATVFPVALLYSCNVGLALSGLATLNIPMYNVLKRTTPAWIIAVEFFYMRGKLPSPAIRTAVALLTIGAGVAGYSDLSFDVAGYAAALGSCLFQVGYLLTVQQTGANKGLSSLEITVYQSALSVPVVVLLALTRDVPAGALARLYDPTLLFDVCVVLGLGGCLTFSMFLNTITNSALSTCIVGCVKGVVSTLMGFALFGGVQITTGNLVGILMSTAGGICYSVAKYRESTAGYSGHSTAHVTPVIKEQYEMVSQTEQSSDKQGWMGAQD